MIDCHLHSKWVHHSMLSICAAAYSLVLVVGSLLHAALHTAAAQHVCVPADVSVQVVATILCTERLSASNSKPMPCLDLLLQDSKDKKRIYYWLNCPGGEVVPTLALYDTMQYVRSKTATVCYGMCLGMGGFLLTAGGEKVRMCGGGAAGLVSCSLKTCSAKSSRSCMLYHLLVVECCGRSTLNCNMHQGHMMHDQA